MALGDSRRKIIYVDDVNYSLTSLKDRLKGQYEIYPAQSTSKMFDVLSRVEPDLILLDVNMPGTDGFETIQKLKSDSRYKEIPVIFLTSQSDKDSIFKGLNLGAAAYVGKPYDTQTLVEQIEAVFSDKKRKNLGKDLFAGEEDTQKLTILAVDDVSIMLRTIQSVLRDKYNVYMLTKPDEIRALLKDITPDLFLLDLHMPSISGFELVPIIRALPEHKHTPIIFITADGKADIMVTAAGLGACDFIVKPISTDILLEKVAKHIKPRSQLPPPDDFGSLKDVFI